MMFFISTHGIPSVRKS